jgi:hypothetical protein
MQSLSTAELESQTVLKLPDRDLMGAIFSISGSINVDLLSNFLNHSFRNWHISILDHNHVQVTVEDDLTGAQVTAFCNETVSAMSAQCAGKLT